MRCEFSPQKDDGWRLSDALWERIRVILPPPKFHPWGMHNPRVDDRSAMDAILFVLRTGCQWNALNQTGICSSSSAHRRFMEWTEAGVFEAFWREGLMAYDELVGFRLRPHHLEKGPSIGRLMASSDTRGSNSLAPSCLLPRKQNYAMGFAIGIRLQRNQVDDSRFPRLRMTV